MSARDVYDKPDRLISIDLISPDLLNKLISHRFYDIDMEKLNDAMEIAIKFLTDGEVELLFLKFVHRNSHKTIKKTMQLGSTKTVSKRCKKLVEAIKNYVFYFMEQNYDSDISDIRNAFGDDAVVVAEMLFKRMSKNAILMEKTIPMSQARIIRTVLNIEILCLKSIKLSGFWEVISSARKLVKK